MKRDYYFWFLMFLLVFSVCLVAFQKGNIHGKAVQLDLSSNVTITKFVAISFSSDLSQGIIFQDVHFLPATNVNATKNFDGLNSSTEYYISVSSDGNTDIDLCIKASGDLENNAGDLIGLANETYSFSLITNSTYPLLNETFLTTSYVKAGETIPLGNSSYVRFWLDVPAGQAAGMYNNSVFFKGNSVGLGC